MERDYLLIFTRDEYTFFMKIQKEPSIAILIVNYKTKKYIIDLLKSFILHETYWGDVYFYIWDNASWEDISDLDQLFPSLQIHTYKIPENRWFWAGNNFLFKKTAEDILFLVNPDTLWRESLLENLIKLQEQTWSAVIWPRLITKKWITQIWDHWELFGIRVKILEKYLGISYWKSQNKVTQVSWISWAAFMIKKERFQSIWGFDENFFLYREEEDLCLRIRKNWWKIYYIPTISMVHHGSVVASMRKYIVNSHILYLKKHHPLIYRLKISEWLARFYFK